MIRVLFTFCFFISYTLVVAQKNIPPMARNMNVTEAQIEFVENKNQWYKDIAFRAEIPNGFLDVQSAKLQYLFYDPIALHKRHEHDEKHPQEPFEEDFKVPYHSFVINFVGASPVKAKASEITPTYYNFYEGSDKNFWADKARAYKKVSYENIYPKISYHLYSKNKTLKYEFHLEQKADPSLIKMQYDFSNGLRILPDGRLEIKTAVGSIYEEKPVSYQYIKGKLIEIPTKFVLNGNEVSFAFPEGYNKKYPLVIDPSMIFSTYSGATSSNYGNTATFDNDGNLYSGSTSFGNSMRANSPTPVLVGSLGGSTNIRLYKYNATGTTLQYVTIIGGNNSEIPHSLVTDGNQLLAFGATGSSDFPSTFGPSFQGGVSASVTAASYSNGTDMYVLKLRDDGTLDRARLLGGSDGNEGINASSSAWTIENYGDGSRGDIYVDNVGSIFVATNSTSSTITGVTGTRQGGQDALLLKFDSNLNLTWGKYFGGTNLDIALSVKVNTLGEILVGGATRSNDFPATTGAANTTYFGDDDGFVAKFDASGTLVRATYLGTVAADMAFFIDVDGDDYVYAYGQSIAASYPIYPTTTQPYNNGASGQFIHKLNADLSITEWSTRVGNGNGSYNLSPTAFLVDNCKNIYIAGYGGWSSIPNVTNSPVTPNAFKSTTDGRDFYLAVFKPDMAGLLYGTYVGGTSSGEHVDGGTSRFAKDGTVYHGVCTNSGFSTTSGAWATTSGTSWDCAVFKFETTITADFTMQDPSVGTPISDGGTSCSQTVNFKFPANVTEYDSFQWQIFDLAGNILYTEAVNEDFQFTFDASGDYRIRLLVSNCAKSAQSIQDLKIAVPNFNVSSDTEICKFGSIQLLASGAVTYKWTPITGLSNPNIADPIASPTETTTYSVTMQDASCKITKKVTVTVLPATALDFKYDILKDCNTPYRVKLALVNTDSSKFTNFRWEMGDGRILQGINPEEFVYGGNDKEYTIKLIGTNPNGCETIKEQKIYIPAKPVYPPNVITPNDDGKNDTFEVAEAKSKIKIWNRWGKLVFSSDDYKNDWGKEKEITSGTYYYFLESPSGVNCNGWIQVMK
ncbi:MAG: gliding motility-associated C-terminal domain-containing protein [Thermonemataceae bacterium]|nr:gliding motility-associated C-terminal domain-containing protein [Thermonemataceae bacterium]